MFEAKFFEWAYHFEDQSRVMPRRMPIGIYFLTHLGVSLSVRHLNQE